MLRMMPRFLKISRSALVFLLPVAACVLGALPAEAQEWAMNKERSRLTFEAEAGGQLVPGEFKQFRAEIRFDPEHIEITEIAAAIDTNTVTTGQPQADAALLSREWFDAQTFPTAGFVMTSIKEGDADGAYILQGNLTIKGRTRPVTLPFMLEIDQGEASVSGETSVNRRDFGLGPDGPVAGPAIGDLVKIKLDLLATRLDN